MKTKITLFLAVLCGAFAQQPTANPSTDTIRAASLSFSVAAESSTITARYLVVVTSSGNEPIVRVGELPFERVINTSPNQFIMRPYRYLRPEKPEELKIELWTRDGKKWEPVWREVK